MPLTSEIGILLNMYGYLGLIPSYNSKTRTFNKTIRNNIFVVVLIIIHGIYVWGKIKYELIDLDHLHFYILNSLVIITSNVLSNLGLNTWNLQRFGLIFKNLDFVDQSFALQTRNLTKITRLSWKYLIFQTLLLTLFFYDFLLWAKGATDLNVFLFYLFSDNINTYFIANMVFLECYILKGIELRFKAFNKLIGCVKMPPDVQVCDFISMHKNLCDAVENYNIAFGWQMLMAILHFTICILIWIIKLITGGYKISGVRTFVIMVYWIMYFLLQGIAVAAMCEKVSNEGKRTITVAYKALQKHAKVPALKEKLFILAQQATARSPEFTAAGFFNVNFSMLFTFVNLIATYVIVIIQFSTPNQK